MWLRMHFLGIHSLSSWCVFIIINSHPVFQFFFFKRLQYFLKTIKIYKRDVQIHNWFHTTQECLYCMHADLKIFKTCIWQLFTGKITLYPVKSIKLSTGSKNRTGKKYHNSGEKKNYKTRWEPIQFYLWWRTNEECDLKLLKGEDVPG